MDHPLNTLNYRKITDKLKDFRTYINAAKSTVSIFALLAIIFGSFFAFKIPYGYAEDEYANLIRAYATSRGDFFANINSTQVINGKTVNIYTFQAPKSLTNMANIGGQAREDSTCTPGQEAYPDEIYSNSRNYLVAGCKKPNASTQDEINRRADASLTDSRVMQARTISISGYPFVAFLPGAVGFGVARVLDTSVGDAIILARMFSLLVSVAITTAAVYLLRNSKAKWLLIATALMPGSIVMAASVNTDSMLIALGMLFFALLIRAFQDKPARLLHPLSISLIVTGVLISMMKTPYAVMLLAVCFAPIFPKANFRLPSRVVFGIMLLFPTALWYSMTKDVYEATGYLFRPGTDRSGELLAFWMLKNPFEFVALFLQSGIITDWISSVNILTHQRVRMPGFIIAMSYSLLAVTGIYAAQDAKKIIPKPNRHAFYVAVLLAGIVAAASIPALTLARQRFTEIPAVIVLQGRYFIPMIPFIFLSIGTALNLKLIPNRYSRYAVFGLLGLILTISSTWYYLEVYRWAEVAA